jgi:uncharacterized cupredoxin-like copper-binding protein
LRLINRLPTNIARLSLVIMLLAIVAVGLAACGGTDATPTPPAAPGGTGATTDTTPTAAGQTSSGSTNAQEVKATLNEWSVTLNVDQVTAGPVKFMVSNEGQNGHDMVVQDASGTEVGRTPAFKKADGVKELDLDLKSGDYTIICDLPGHAEKGMKTTLTAK